MTKPRIKYNIDTGFWECCEGKLCNLGQGTTPKDAYLLWEMQYNWNRGNTKAAELLSMGLVKGGVNGEHH